MTSRFTVFHVGARFGSSPFPILDAFADDIDLILFDADKDCIDGLLERQAELPSIRRIVPACLSDRDGVEEFNLTINPSASSLLEPSPASRGFVQPMFGIDWDVEQCATVVERRRVEARRLDTLLAEQPDIPAPDFLSIDTQGSELQILEGLGQPLLQGIVGLIVEVEFIELYRNVKRFGDLAGFLEKQGFHFARFIDMIDALASRQPIGRRSDGFPVAADALFLRRVDTIGERDRQQVLDKLAFASIAFGHLDHAFAALARQDTATAKHRDAHYQEFLDALRAASDAMPRIFLPQFPEILPAHEIARFSREADIAQWPKIMDLGPWRAEMESRGMEVDQAVEALNANADSPVEAVLRRYGFSDLADRTSFCRRDQSYKLQSFLAAAKAAG